MHKKVFITVLITLIVGVLLFLCNMEEKVLSKANFKYQVYLHGNSIGLIDSEDDLYDLIDKSQTSIKQEYDVSNVYPPTDLKIIATNTYSNKKDNIKDVYNKIEEVDDFTVKGYVITIKSEEEEIKINVLDEEVFRAMRPYFTEKFGNPSSVYTIGKENKEAINVARMNYQS